MSTYQYERLAREVRGPAKDGERGKQNTSGAFEFPVAHSEEGVFEEVREAGVAGTLADAPKFAAGRGNGGDHGTDGALLKALVPIHDEVAMVVEDGNCGRRRNDQG